MSGAVEQRPQASRALVVRRALASLASLGVELALLRTFASAWDSLTNGRWIPALVLLAAPVVAGGAIWSRRLTLQLLARALWWSLLLFGGLVSLLEPGVTGVAIACGSATALLGAGRTALDGGDGRFRPVAFRGTLMLALVLAMADAASFLWLGLAQAITGEVVRLIWFVPPMIAGVIGLLRLRTWGLLVSLACNLLVVVFAIGDALALPKELKGLFIATAAAQLLVPIPMWIMIIRRKVPSADGWERPKRIVSTLVIVAIAAISVCSALVQPRFVAP